MVDHGRPTVDNTQSSIVRPLISVTIFGLKPTFIQMVQQSCSFYGLPDEDPNAHLSTFFEVYDMLKPNGVSNNAIHLRVFPFSFKSKAKELLQTLPRALVATLDQLAKLPFPLGRTTKLWHNIASFTNKIGRHSMKLGRDTRTF